MEKVIKEGQTQVYSGGSIDRQYGVNTDAPYLNMPPQQLIDIVGEKQVSAGKLVLSPTRTYAPILKAILTKNRAAINGLVHCSGGAQTKVLHFIKNTCGGRFMACDKEGSGNWGELSDDAARRKIGQSLREKNKRYMPPPRSRKNSKRNNTIHFNQTIERSIIFSEISLFFLDFCLLLTLLFLKVYKG